MKKKNSLKEEQAHALLQAYCMGDQQAFLALYDMYAGMLLSYGACITSDRELVKDCVQDVFVKLISKRDCLQINKVTSYLVTSLRNKLLDTFRRGSYMAECAVEDCQIHEVEDGVEYDYIYAEDKNADNRTLDMLLDVLTPRQRQVFTLYYLEEREYDEISQIMNMNYSSLRNLVHRGMVKMRTALAS